MFQNISDVEQKSHNLPNNSAGYLIDQAGLKNTKIGAFVVSEQHGNFIINTGEGDPKDLQDLMNLIKLKVQEKFGIELKEEVIVI